MKNEPKSVNGQSHLQHYIGRIREAEVNLVSTELAGSPTMESDQLLYTIYK